jgi:predicted DNA-binding transcriptional regulator AlpA
MNEQKHDAIDKALFYDLRDMMRELKCSDKHIFNLRKSGRIPQPVKLGERVIWPRKVIEQWIDAGCPAIAV